MSTIKTNTIENVAGTESHDVATMGIESGSNTNGEYTKFPDGTLICTGIQTHLAVSHTISVGSFFRSGATAIDISWAPAFVGEYAVTANLSTDAFISDDFIGIQQIIKRDENYGHVVTLAATSGDKDVAINFQAIGRWK